MAINDDLPDDQMEALRGLLGSTYKYISPNSDVKLQLSDNSHNFVFSYPGVLHIGRPDPIHGNYLQLIPRGAAPDRSVFIQFEQDKVCVYEQDEYNSKHLRFSIPYANINSILAIASNKLLTPNEVNVLELISELRSTQASLFESAVALREAKDITSIARDSEVSRLKAELHVSQTQSKLKSEEIFRLNLEHSDLQKELNQIKQEIADRKKALAHLELFDDNA